MATGGAAHPEDSRTMAVDDLFWPEDHGTAQLSTSQHIKGVEEFRDLLPVHRLDVGHLPYKKTWGSTLCNVQRLPNYISYKHPYGAQSIIIIKADTLHPL
eukprot:7642706-Karenia_brevis.AAC.1